MRLKEIITEASIGRGVGKVAHGLGAATGAVAHPAADVGSGFVQGIKQGFGSSFSPKKMFGGSSKAKDDLVSGNDRGMLRVALEKILKGEQLSSQELTLLRSVKRKL